MVTHQGAAERYLSPSAAKEHLNALGIDIGERTIYKAVADGTLPAVRAGGRKLYVTVTDLERHFLTPASEQDQVDVFIDDLVERAPELSQEQRDRLAVLIKDAPVPAGDKAAS